MRGEQPPEQRKLLTKDHLKLVQARLQAEGGSVGPVNGELNAQTEAARRAYPQKQGSPVSGAADEATLKQLQIDLPASPGGRGKAVQGLEARVVCPDALVAREQGVRERCGARGRHDRPLITLSELVQPATAP